MYGSDSNSPNLDIMPASYCNMPIFYNNYYCMIANKALNNTVGWPKINEFITKMDASNAIGKTVYTYNYTPKISYLTAPWNNKYARIFNNDSPSLQSFGIASMTSGEVNRVTILNAEKNTEKHQSVEMTQLNTTNFQRIFHNKNRIYQPIEMSQFVQRGINKSQGDTLQPSLHIGIYPVHKMTTTSNTITPQDYTDVECTWDISIEMEIGFGFPNHFTQFDEPHVLPENTLYTFNTTDDYYYHESLSSFDNRFVTPINASVSRR